MQDRIWQSRELAQRYLEGVRAALPLAAEQIEAMLRVVAAREAPVRRALDLGCGDGVLAAAILDAYPHAEAVLLDFSAPMLDAARTRLAGRNATFLDRDYGDPSWRDGLPSFDVVVSGFSIHHQPDRRKRELYAEIYQALEPGGVFLNLEHVASPTLWVERMWDDLMIDALWRQSSNQDRAAVARAHHQRPDKAANILAPVDAQCDWLRHAGFTDVDCYLKIFELALFGGRKPDPEMQTNRCCLSDI